MYEVGRRKDPHFEARRRNDFQTSRGAVVGGYGSTDRVLLPGHVEAVLLDQHDVGRDDRRNKVWLASSSLVNSSHPTMHPIVLIRPCGCGRLVFVFAPARECDRVCKGASTDLLRT